MWYNDHNQIRKVNLSVLLRLNTYFSFCQRLMWSWSWFPAIPPRPFVSFCHRIPTLQCIASEIKCERIFWMNNWILSAFDMETVISDLMISNWFGFKFHINDQPNRLASELLFWKRLVKQCYIVFELLWQTYRVTEVLAELNSGDKVDDGCRWKPEGLEISIERPRIL